MSSIDDRGYWDKLAADQAAARPEAIRAALAERYGDEWTVEVTQQRRAEWNARVKAGEFNNSKGKIDPLKLRDAQQDQGWTTIELKLAIERHGL